MTNDSICKEYTQDAITLLKQLIATPSVSRNEEKAADILVDTITSYGFTPIREGAPHAVAQCPYRYREGGGIMDERSVRARGGRGYPLWFGQ